MKFAVLIALLAIVGLLACSIGGLLANPTDRTACAFLPVVAVLSAACSISLVAAGIMLAGSIA